MFILSAGDSIGNCSRPLGMEVGSISDYQMTSTSVETAWWGDKWTSTLARIHQTGTVNAWMPNDNGRNQYIQVKKKAAPSDRNLPA